MKMINLFLVCLLTLTCQAQTNLPEDVVQSIQQRLDLGLNSSIAIGILDADGVHYFNFGRTKKGGTLVNEHTIYEIGSISKTFTAILLADAAGKGLVQINDPAQKYLPKTVNMPMYDGKVITLGHLSDHTSSLPRMPNNFEPEDPTNPYVDYTEQDMYDFISNYSLTHAIGSEYEYSNLAQGLLGHILAMVAGTNYESLLQLTITTPLGMHETAVAFTPEMLARLAYPHSGGVESSNWDLSVLTGAGGIRSSVHDMLIYLRANLGLQESDLYPAMQTTHTFRHDKAGVGIGLAWFITPGSEGEVISHGGQTGGYNAFAGFCKESGRAVVVLTNSDEPTDDIGKHLLNSASPLKPIAPHIAREIRRIIDAEGVLDLEKKYQAVKDSKPDFYDTSEDEINTLGYSYLGRDQLETALAIFKINTIENPESFNVWDSYAEGLMHKGDTVNSIKYYQKSLELNPGNTNAIEMLDKMGEKTELKTFQVPGEILATYVGNYELAPGFVIAITHLEDRLYGQATGQQRFELHASSETRFYLTVVDAQVKFNKNDDGSVKSLTLFQGGQATEGVKMEE